MLANANCFANEIAKISSSLRKYLANGSLRQNSLAIANAMAWCTQLGKSGKNPKNLRRVSETPTPSGRFGYFVLFSARGGEGESEPPGGGVSPRNWGGGGGRAKQVPFVKLAFKPGNGAFFELKKAFFADHVCVQMLQNKAFWPRFTFSQEAKTWKEKCDYFYSVKMGEREKSL